MELFVRLDEVVTIDISRSKEREIIIGNAEGTPIASMSYTKSSTVGHLVEALTRLCVSYVTDHEIDPKTKKVYT